MTTPRERLREATDKGFEFLEQLEAANAVIKKAKLAEDDIRNGFQLGEMEANAAEDIEDKTKSAQHVYDATVAEARKPLARAERLFESKRGPAETRFDAAIHVANEDWEKKMAKYAAAYEVKAAEAKIAIHTARQEAAIVQTSIDRHCKQVESQLGIDLKAYLQAVGG